MITAGCAGERLKDLPPNSLLLASPHDPDARLGSKRDLRWTGYKVHVTETCEEDFVHLITHVATIQPNRHDNQLIPDIHRVLESKILLPAIHLVDAGYMDTELLVESRKSYAVRLHGPLPANHRWQAKTEGAYSINDFAIDWEDEQVTCPNDKQSVYWSQRLDKRNNNKFIFVLFAKSDCFPVSNAYAAIGRTRTRVLSPSNRKRSTRRSRLPGAISKHLRGGPPTASARVSRARYLKESGRSDYGAPAISDGVKCISRTSL